MYPIGYINNRLSFTIVGVIDGKPSYLDFSQIGGYYYWNSSGEVKSTNTIPSFTFIQTENGFFEFTDVIHGGGIGISSSENTLVNTSAGRDFTLDTNKTPVDDVILSMNPYTLLDNNTVVSIYTDSAKSSSVGAQNILMLPTNYRYNCDGETFTNVAGISNVILTWIDQYNSSSFIPSWISEDECEAGVSYEYCVNPDTCGTNGCYGPCSSGKCKFDGTSYSCDDNDTIRWGIAIAVIVIIVIVLFAIIAIARHHK